MSDPGKTVDSLLVIAYQAGDKNAFDLLVKRWNKRLCMHAYRYVNDWDVAKDVVQDTWSVIINKISMLRDSHSFGSWAMTITGRKAIDVRKRSIRFEQEVDKVFWDNQKEELLEGDSKEEDIQKILTVFTTLSLEHQLVLKLFYMEDYSLKEISRITKTSVNTVKTRLFRAREKIKQELKH